MKFRTIVIISVLALVITVFISLVLGKYPVTLSQILDIIASYYTGHLDPSLNLAKQAVMEIRLPRIIFAGVVGAGLAISGAVMQGTFQNPLVSPDLLGVCSGAGFGAALGIILFGDVGTGTAILAFITGMSSIALVYLLSRRKGESNVLSTVLCGIIVSSIFTALISLIKYTADPENELPAITFWLMGSFTNVTFSRITLLLPIVAGIIMMLLLRWRVNLLSLGDDECQTMGINPNKTRWTLIIFAALTTAGCVVVSGVIGWVGLVIPHICRMLAGPNHNNMLPLSCLIGAIFLIIVDTLARNIVSAEVPIGILTALIGAPFFLMIYNSSKARR